MIVLILTHPDSRYRLTSGAKCGTSNILLNKMKIKSSELCDTCKEKDYIEHFFVNCKKLNGFRPHISNVILFHTNKVFGMTEPNILLGFPKQYRNYTNRNIDVANHILLIAKMSISKMRYRNDNYCRDVFRIFEEEMLTRKKYL